MAKLKCAVFAAGAVVSFYTMCAYWGAIETGRADPVKAGIMALAAMLCGLGCAVMAMDNGQLTMDNEEDDKEDDES